MSASLVGSEMCIRDRPVAPARTGSASTRAAGGAMPLAAAPALRAPKAPPGAADASATSVLPAARP
eukprot:1754824-Alexandrium_andersonii.AAC.1